MKDLDIKKLTMSVAALISIHREVLACSVCFGDPKTKMSQGLFAAMYLLLGLIVFVLGGIAWTGIVWAKRAKNVACAQRGGL